jgi:hypothetical protein
MEETAASTAALKGSIGIRGHITIRRHPAGTIDRIRALRAAGNHELANAVLRSGEVGAETDNLIVDSANCGIDLLIQWLVSGLNSSLAFPIGPQWGEIGTGTTAPTISDTALTTPTVRAQLAYAADLSFNEAQLQFFFADGNLANGTYHEFGTFVGTSSTIGSGQMFNHALFSSPYSKSNGNDTTVEVDITIANL